MHDAGGINEVDSPLLGFSLKLKLGARSVLWCLLSNVPHVGPGNSFVFPDLCPVSAESELWLSIWQPKKVNVQLKYMHGSMRTARDQFT